jgi:hypothetical protein
MLLALAAIAGWRVFMLEPRPLLASEVLQPVAGAEVIAQKKRRKKKSQRHN